MIIESYTENKPAVSTVLATVTGHQMRPWTWRGVNLKDLLKGRKGSMFLAEIDGERVYLLRMGRERDMRSRVGLRQITVFAT